MNSYQRIQAAIDHIESHLTEPIELSQVASAACFSLSHFYRIFHALVGHSVKEYIRKRRLAEAAQHLIESDTGLIQIAFDYQFESQESFTRAFKAMFGMTPGRFRRLRCETSGFPRRNIIDEYFADDPVNVLDPGIKVLKTLKPMKVAYCRIISESPEKDSWAVLTTWADRTGLVERMPGYRMFGFDNPGPTQGCSTYGYESCMTVDDKAAASGEVGIKTLPGGLYAVTGTTVAEIGAAWAHFVRWQAISRYRPGSHQCLEENLSTLEEPGENTPIDLYLPVKQP